MKPLQSCIDYLKSFEKDDFLEQCEYNDVTPEDCREGFQESSHIFLQAEKAELELDKINDYCQEIYNALERIPLPIEEIRKLVDKIQDSI